jgi:peptidylprolyl isomerase domain and WD repeat-containing protein 1
MIKFFDVQSFDMSNMITAKHVPTAVAWLNGRTGLFTRVAVADANSGLIRIYRSEGEQEPIAEVGIHSSPVKCLSLNVVMTTVISVDMKGVIEYWDVDTFDLPSDKVGFKYKTETDLYDLAKARTLPCSIVCSQQGLVFATLSQDKKIRVFDFETGKLRRKYDEAVTVYSSDLSTVAAYGIDSLDLGRRVAVEKDLESLPDVLCRSNAVFDESGNFLIYSSLVGIKILNLFTNRVVRTLGTPESGERFLALCLYQGVPKVDAQYMLAKSSSSSSSGGGGGGGGGVGNGDNSTIKSAEQLHANPIPDPTVICTSFKRRRFYLFSSRNPDETNESRLVCA